MKTTVTIDDELLRDAKELSGITETDDVLAAALRSLLQREASRHLADLGGTMPDLEYPRRYRGLEEE